jgi:hypothetical protein
MTAIILSVLKLGFGSLRVDEEEEFEGLDLSQHSESAYTSVSSGSVLSPAGAMGGHHSVSIGPLTESSKLA